ncbi:MAG: aromatic amino acid lyase [Rhizomicrobium sp.]
MADGKFDLEIGSGLLLAALRGVYERPCRITIAGDALAAIERGAKAIDGVVARGETVYGVNTGFGLLANTSIAKNDLEELQRNLVLSHACGVGPLLSDDVVRLILVLKAASLSRGASGVKRETVLALQRLVEAEVYPCIPSKGSVGASGDLAPLAHMAALLIGVGEARVNGEIVPAAKALEKADLKPLVLGPKEGLALLNGTQVSTALALGGLFEIEKVFTAAIVAGAMSTDALKGSDTPFDARIHAFAWPAGADRCCSGAAWSDGGQRDP